MNRVWLRFVNAAVAATRRVILTNHRVCRRNESRLQNNTTIIAPRIRTRPNGVSVPNNTELIVKPTNTPFYISSVFSGHTLSSIRLTVTARPLTTVIFPFGDNIVQIDFNRRMNGEGGCFFYEQNAVQTYPSHFGQRFWSVRYVRERRLLAPYCNLSASGVSKLI